jgi:hypothetical protein
MSAKRGRTEQLVLCAACIQQDFNDLSQNPVKISFVLLVLCNCFHFAIEDLALLPRFSFVHNSKKILVLVFVALQAPASGSAAEQGPSVKHEDRGAPVLATSATAAAPAKSALKDKHASDQQDGRAGAPGNEPGAQEAVLAPCFPEVPPPRNSTPHLPAVTAAQTSHDKIDVKPAIVPADGGFEESPGLARNPVAGPDGGSADLDTAAVFPPQLPGPPPAPSDPVAPPANAHVRAEPGPSLLQPPGLF